MTLAQQREYLDAQDWNRPQYGTSNTSDRGPRRHGRWSLLDVFKEGCWDHYHKYGRKWPAKAPRAAALMTLSDRYEYRLMRWLPKIEMILDKAEQETRDEPHS